MRWSTASASPGRRVGPGWPRSWSARASTSSRSGSVSSSACPTTPVRCFCEFVTRSRRRRRSSQRQRASRRKAMTRPSSVTPSMSMTRAAAHSFGSIRTGFSESRPARCALIGPRRSRGESMKSETIAIHAGYDVDPTTKAVAVPIYQTVAYEFDSAEHGAALFNLEVEGFRYSRISNPTTAVLERRVAALEGGVEALAVSTGQAALNYAALNVTQLGGNIVSVPQLYGTTHTLFAHVLPSQGVSVRFAESDQPDAIARLIDDKTTAVFCETVGNPAGNICDLE